MFRIDHYLGKETVQNIWRSASRTRCSSRSGTTTMSTMCRSPWLGTSVGWPRRLLRRHRAARDVIQNHLIQLLALTALEEPVSFHPHEVTAEKIKVLSATSVPNPRPHHVTRPIYGGLAGRRRFSAPRRGRILKESTTETFAAITLEVDTRRWAGVPFYLRTGKRWAAG